MSTAKKRLAALAACSMAVAAIWVAATLPTQAADEAVAKTAKPALTVTTTTPRNMSLPQKLVANGNLAAWQEAIIGAEVNGLRIRELHVAVGDMVQRGQLLASFADETVKAELAQAQAALSEARANAQDAQQNASRASNLRNSGALSEQQIGQYETARQSAEARLESARAAVEMAQLRLKYTRVLAPDAGQISARLASIGAVAGNGAELFRLIRQNRLEWRAEVTANVIAGIPVGSSVVLSAPSGSQIKGKVRQIAPTVDAQTRLGLVYVDVQAGTKDAAAFKPGMYVRGEFELGTTPALVILQQAVVVRDGMSYAFRLNADGRVSQIRLQTGRRVASDGAQYVEVLSGLNPASTVVASGAGFLNDGDLVRVANTPGTAKGATAATTATTATTPSGHAAAASASAAQSVASAPAADSAARPASAAKK